VDQIKSQLDRLADLDDEQVTELETSIVTEFESVEAGETTPESVDAMTALAEMLETVRAETQRRVAQAEELATRAAEAAARVKGDGIEEAEVAPMEEEEPVSNDEDEMPSEEDSEESDEAEMDEEAPSMEEEEEDEDKDKTMSEASTESEETAEFTADSDENIVEEVVEAEAVEADAEELSSVEDDAEVFSADEAEEPIVEEEVVVEAVADEAEASEEATSEEVFSAEEVVAEESETEIETSEPEAQEEAPVTAAVDGTIDVPADRRPVAPVESAPVAITAGADIPGHSAGSTLADMREVAEAMEKRLHSLRRVNGGDGEQHIVASIATQYPEDRVLGTDPEENRAKIERVVGAEALVASGGFATPLEVRYDVFGLGTAIRPVRDSLPRFQADRGGVRYVTPPVLSSYADAVGVWTNETDEDPGDETKASLTVTAAQELTAYTDAITLQMQFGNLFTRAYPELLARHNELGLIQHAREAEQNILGRIADDSTAVTTASLIGFARDFLVQIRRAAAAYRSRHRIDPSTQLRAIIPSWVYDAMAADLSLAMPGDGTLSVSSSEINGYLANSNVSLVASLDANTFGSQSTGALLEFPDSFTWYLFAEGTFLFLDGGTLDLGIIRDSGLVGTNDYKMFVETFEGVAKVGVESLAITSTISVNGVAAALRDTTGGATAAAIEY
jgi:hypothetical protein